MMFAVTEQCAECNRFYYHCCFSTLKIIVYHSVKDRFIVVENTNSFLLGHLATKLLTIDAKVRLY